LRASPLSVQLGLQIGDISLGSGLSDAEMRQLLEQFYESGVIVIRDQDLTLEQFDAFASRFGQPKPHFLDHLRLPGFPAVLLLSNIHQDGRPTGVYEGAAFWHTDVAYQDPPNSATIVYAVKTPAVGGRTWFANQYAAYEALPVSLKARIDKLQVVHHYGNRADMDENSRTSAERLTPEQKRRVTNVVMPLVRRHPITGRKALYGVAGSSFHIVGMPDAEAVELLNELADHGTQPRFVTSHEYKIGDVAAWDTFSTLHKADLLERVDDPADPQARLLYRISVTGISPLFETVLPA
jgi:taurine dioxygenase